MLRRTPPLTALLLATALSGCLSGDGASDAADAERVLDPLTEPVYDLLGHFEHRFTGTTGVQLYVDYYLPDTGGEQVPVVLTMTPYQGPDPVEAPAEGGGPVGGEDAPYSQFLVDHFVPRGYAVAFADVRGNHNAGGCIDQTGPEQWQDGYDYVEWLGTREWSNGRVGMYGASYDGETQFTTAMLAPPHLTTIVPTASVSNQYEWNFYNGVPYELQPLLGMAGYFAISAVPSTSPEDAPTYPEKLTCQPEQFVAGTDFSGDNTTFWQERDYRAMAGDIQASVLHVHGLADWNVRPVHIDPLFNDIQSQKRGLFGLWHHAYPDRGDWLEILTAWYDHFLLGRDNGILERLPPVLIEDSTGAWHGMQDFPPRDQPWMDLELSADGTLAAPGAAQAGQRVLNDRPTEVLVDPVVEPPYGLLGPVDDAPTELRFTWKVPEDLHLVGRPEVLLRPTTDQTSTHWIGRLEVDTDPRCEYTYKENLYTQGVCINSGYQDTRHRDGHNDPKDLTPGEPYDLRIRMYPQYDVVPAGSVLTLVLSNNDAEVQQDPTNAVSTVPVGDGTALLRLPLAPARTMLPHDALPAVYPGH